MQSVLETVFSAGEYCPLPPVQEAALSESQKLEIKPQIDKYLPTGFKNLALCKRSKTLSISGFTYQPDLKTLFSWLYVKEVRLFQLVVL